MIYREFTPSPALAALVDRLWWLEGPAELIGAEPIPPDGHTEITVHGGWRAYLASKTADAAPGSQA